MRLRRKEDSLSLIRVCLWNISGMKSLLLGCFTQFHYFLLLYLFFYVSHKIFFCEIKLRESFLFPHVKASLESLNLMLFVTP